MTIPTVLYLVETPGQFVELERFVGLLAASRPAAQVFLVYDCGAATAHVLERIKAAGTECLNATAPSDQDARRRLLDAIPTPLRALLRFVRDMMRGPLLATAYRRLLRRRKIDMVVVNEDTVGGRSRALVAAASGLGIPILLLPYTISNPDEAVATRARNPAHQVRRLYQRLFAAWRPAWARNSPQGRLLRLPVSQALMLELTGLAPEEPWIADRGRVPIAVESQAMLRHYRALGFAPDQLVLTGSAVDPVLESALQASEQRRQELRRTLALADRPILLCALPPDQLSSGAAASDFADHAALVEAWTSCLAAVSEHFSIVVRPHPRLTEESLIQVRRAGLAVSWDDTATLIPLCDLYVASISATIRWAVACGKPVINYDVYRYRLNDYVGVPGVFHTERLDEFRQILLDLADQPERLAAMTAAQAGVAADWGCLDGGSSRRLMTIVDRMLDAA